jgi:type I restriction enzyme S subunit
LPKVSFLERGKKDTLLSRLYHNSQKISDFLQSRSEIREVEQLMGLYDELELKLRKSREDSEKLMETVVRGLLEGAAAEI